MNDSLELKMIQKKNPYQIKVFFIQPVLAPYRRPLFEKLNEYEDIELKVVVLSPSFSHRETWNVRECEDFEVETLNNIKIKATSKLIDGNKIKGIRVIPFKLIKSLYSYRPEIIFCTNTTEYIFALPYKLFNSVKIGCWVEDTPYINSQRSWLMRRIKGMIYKNMDFWLANGVESINYLSSIGIDRNRVKPAWCSVDNNLYQHKKEFKSHKKKWLGVGGLITGKGYDLLIKAWNEQPNDFHQRNELLIVGQGSEDKNLKALVKQLRLENVFFAGFKLPEQLADLYSKSDVFVFPTVQDIWGLVVNEAMASGLPIVCSKYAGCQPDLVSNRNGAIVDPLDHISFSRSLTSFEEKQEHWTEMGVISKQVIAKYTIENTAKAIYQVVMHQNLVSMK